ncbi:MAG TPA: bifunctional acetate--CoA ligase family protein/GNAT family N-acetyltransferase [Quisquiliibacterium sp.]|nr:bifunctional acetate--CoA ligase family protein/GNAT family N-acetyltransferase [Quisquiliibacterium sp.]
MEHRHFLTPLFDPASILLLVEGDDALPGWAATLVDAPPASVKRAVLRRLSDPGDLPEPGFDLAIVVACHGAVRAALDVAAKLAVRAAVLVCDHADPVDARAWAQVAQRAGIRLLGPGTMGFVRPPLGLNAGRMGPMPKDGNLALVSQSGVLNGAILDWAGGTVLGFSLAVSLGAEADVDLAQVLDYLANDARTRSVVVYLEAVRESRSFMSALRALASVKPVVVLKGNRDEASRRRALTHSGALCGSDAIYTAALRRAGAVQVRLFTQLFTAAQMLATSASPLGRRLAVISNGNGPAVLASDVAMWNGVRIPAPSAATVAALAARLPTVVVENPMNLGVDARASDFEAALAAVMADPEFDAVLTMLAPYTGVDAAGITDTLIAAAKGSRKKVLACWMGDQGVRPYRRALDDAGIPVFRTPETAVDAYSTVTVFHQNQQLLQQTPRSLSGLEAPDLEGARMLIESVLAERRQVLTEMESKALLGAFHVPVTRTMIARSPTEAIVIAEQMGFPVAMKIASYDVTHKSDVGGVVLNVRNAAEVRAQYGEIIAAVRRAQPKARIEGVTVQAMRRSRFARELYVGVYRDPLFGPVIAFGAGGTRIEVVRDTTIEFPPLNRFLARRMIERTRVAESLGAFRGAPEVDLEVLEALLVRVSEMVCELPWIAEMDINPAIADENGVVAVDARIVIDPAAGNLPVRYAHMAIMPYPAHLTQVRSAPDGQFYTIRPIQPEDADRLQAFMRALSPESRYFRFISTLSELTPKMLVRYTQIDYDRELALVAVQQRDPLAVPPEGAEGAGGAGGSEDLDEERIIGVVRYLLNPDRETCEFAIAIADDWQGKRLGSTLMRAIIEAARNKGLRRIEGYVLGSNARMLGLMTYLGFKVETDRDDPSMKIVGMTLV